MMTAIGMLLVLGSLLAGLGLLLFGVWLVAASLVDVGPDEYLLVSYKLPGLSNPPEGHFIAQGWQRGWQAAVKTVGIRWVFGAWISWIAEIQKKPLVELPAGKFGLVEALDGETLPPAWTMTDKDIPIEEMLDGGAFLARGGHRGPQIRMLTQGGKYPLNEKLFRLSPVEPATVPTGQVAVQISNVGGDPDQTDIEETITSVKGKNVYILEKKGGPNEVYTKRGIRPDILYQGVHPVNPKATGLEFVDVTPITIKLTGTDLSIGGRKHHFSKLTQATNEPFMVPLNAELILVVTPENAPRVIALAGSLLGLLTDLIVPYLNDVTQTVLSKIPVSEIIKNREGVRRKIEAGLWVTLLGPDVARKKMQDAGFSEEDQHDAQELGRQKDPGQYYTCFDIRSFRIDSIDYHAADPELKKHLDIWQRKANAEREPDALKEELKAEEVRTTLARQQATTGQQEMAVQAELDVAAAGQHAKATEIRGKAITNMLRENGSSDPMTNMMIIAATSPAVYAALQNAGEALRAGGSADEKRAEAERAKAAQQPRPWPPDKKRHDHDTPPQGAGGGDTKGGEKKEE